MDNTQLNLREPEQVNWENYNTSGSNYQAPPDVLDEGGRTITFYGVVEGAEERANQYAVDAEGNGYLNFLLDPVRITSDLGSGYVIRFTEASVKPFEKAGKPIAGNPNKLANFLRAAGTQAKPQTNDQYRASVKQVIDQKRKFGFTLDWVARGRETGEKISGYTNFPLDPATGKRKAILKKGDIYTVSNRAGEIIETKTVEAEVLFANATLKYFQDPNRGTK